MAGESGAVGAGSFDTDTFDRPEGLEPAHQSVVTRRCRRERRDAEQPADRVDRRGYVHIKVGVDAAGDRARRIYDGHAIPFLIEVVGWHARPGKETVTRRLL